MDTNLAMWGLVVGFLSPLVISVIQQPSWSQQVRSLVMFAFALVAGFGTAWLGGQLNGTDITTSVLIVMVTAISTYEGLWKKTGLASVIELATSPKPKALTGVVEPSGPAQTAAAAPPESPAATAKKKPSSRSR